ncbi:DUF502 domain-containing protein [bacterium endosymbiont of Bathymodiolus sp. 5 South]|jgi:uncharacterized membrane protein|uniref:DUF502 domain-containing protein n=1 Tax=bacterium endosymbiont of Bathymodiolus sp. 5 South TaxID=1181670 RepID=UPI0010B3336B|nr:DUF502 domain-containing protein [bacterium endosymbiont of Bathymodiolus sp. 5 South]CAC9634800.1 Uncharacterized membrane anchored protein [uncultured Gammaproteobacteria bacterium]SHN89417.1 hypothetical protein BCLUESOX_889 [bacterium endosymbiont of Bathymodiolus sp. 5 South]SSC07041.1 hypothetical protein BTURTLESOX_1736 [bacterium endosymbiont of Bathymodiolus sp. 5 South]VVH56602.1 hypothetical protein BSPCLSOX_920 [uncultured Gammaproteobacteria bacterium]VVH61290.1 hypothetical pr
MFKKIINTALQGFFWILPILLIIFIANWLFEKAEILTHILFSRTNANIEEHLFLWTIIGIIIIVLALLIIGNIATTRLAFAFDLFIKKVPFYSTIKDIVDIFNSSKKGKNEVLVVAIKGLTQSGYNIGLMYSTKESIIKNHYTVTLSMSPIPNGGFMFEVHQDDILVIEGAKFNDNLNYLLSMGTKSMTEILNQDSNNSLISFTQWRQKHAST